MRAAIKRGTRIVCDEIADPVPGPGQVLVRTAACGICGSDLHAVHHTDLVARLYQIVGVPNAPNPGIDMVFGHEFSGELLDFGPATERKLKPGALVTSVPRLNDVSGTHVVGYSNRFPGGYAERMVLSEAMLLEVPNGLSAVHAALTEPFAVGEHAVAMADMQAATAALVVGCGPVGLAVIAALKARSFGPVIAADFAPGRRRLAERLGADVIIDPSEKSPHQSWQDYGIPITRADRGQMLAAGHKPGRAIIFECVGVPGVLQTIVEEAPSTSQILVVGVCMEPDRFEPGIAIAKELEFRFCYGYTADEFAQTLRNIAEGRIDAAPVVTSRIGLSSVPDAFAALATPGEEVKIIIEPSRP
jgi:threonine dehydrogenase-like Zn-dependent dehydrogenase